MAANKKNNVYKWVPLLGDFDVKNDKIIFNGGTTVVDSTAGAEEVAAVGNIICDRRILDGDISAVVEFDKIDQWTGCEIILYLDSTIGFLLTAGIGGGGQMFSIRYFSRGKWTYERTTGDRRNLRAKTKYDLQVSYHGSRITLIVDGIEVAYTDFSIPLTASHVGLWCCSSSRISATNFKVHRVDPKVFVIMQFSGPYNELYEEVIKAICEEFKFHAIRADEKYGPGIIIADIEKEIRESQIIIADISPLNANVYYELGFAHALRKEVILIAEKNTKLPFDISPFRTLFYENSISGKTQIEQELRKHIEAIVTKKARN